MAVLLDDPKFIRFTKRSTREKIICWTNGRQRGRSAVLGYENLLCGVDDPSLTDEERADLNKKAYNNLILVCVDDVSSILLIQALPLNIHVEMQG